MSYKIGDLEPTPKQSFITLLLEIYKASNYPKEVESLVVTALNYILPYYPNEGVEAPGAEAIIEAYFASEP